MEEVKSIINYPVTKNNYPVGIIILTVYPGYSLIMRTISVGSPILLFRPFLLPYNEYNYAPIFPYIPAAQLNGKYLC